MAESDRDRPIRAFIVEELASMTGLPKDRFDGDTPLIGPQSPIKSQGLVELMLAVEDYAADHLGVVLDWMSDSAMSEQRSIVRTVDSLTSYVAALM